MTPNRRSLADLVKLTESLNNVGLRATTVCEITGVSYRQLDYWINSGLITVSGRNTKGSGTVRLLSYRDALNLSIIKALIDEGISLQRVRSITERIFRLTTKQLVVSTFLIGGSKVVRCRTAEQVAEKIHNSTLDTILCLRVTRLASGLAVTLTKLPDSDLYPLE